MVSIRFLVSGPVSSIEFFGNLYHLNAEEEPELPDYPKNPSVCRHGQSGDQP